MEDKTVQMAIRLTEQERELIKEQAEQANKSMNQYVLDSVLYQNDTDDNIDGIIVMEQLAVKDGQIKELQKLLNQQQQLTLSDKAELQELKLHASTLEPSNGQKKTFWERVFNL